MQQRMVRYLINHGVLQFLGLDAGVPTLGHLHEVAQLQPDTRVIYADRDPLIVQDGQDLLAGNDHTAYLHADVRCAQHLLTHPGLHKLINLHEPVAIIMVDTLLHAPDQDNAAALIAAYTNAMSPGSYLGLSQFSRSPDLLDGLALYTHMYGTPLPIPLREPDHLAPLFTDLDVVEPGIVPVPLWHPNPGAEAIPYPERIPVHTGLGRKS